jgi:hypothetical protein
MLDTIKPARMPTYKFVVCAKSEMTRGEFWSDSVIAVITYRHEKIRPK